MEGVSRFEAVELCEGGRELLTNKGCGEENDDEDDGFILTYLVRRCVWKFSFCHGATTTEGSGKSERNNREIGNLEKLKICPTHLGYIFLLNFFS